MAVELRSLLLRYPLAHATMGTVLREDGLRWKKRPLRSTPGALNKRMVRWQDTSASIVDSLLFTSLGAFHTPLLAPLVRKGRRLCSAYRLRPSPNPSALLRLLFPATDPRSSCWAS